jgi:integrase
MSTRKFRNNWGVDFRFGGHRYRQTSPENSKAGAEAYEAILRHRLARGEPIGEQVANQLPTFKDFSQEWYKKYALTNNKPSEQESKRTILGAYLVPFFGSKHLNEITNLRVEEYKAHILKKGLAPKTINNHLTILAKCLRTAQEWVGLEVLPKIKHLRVPPQKTDFLSVQESDGLLASINNTSAYALLLLALRTGLRLGELRGLEWPDVDLRSRMITVRQSVVRGLIGSPKSNKKRYIPMTNELYQVLLPLKKTEGFVFGRNDGRPASADTMRTILRRACRKSGIREIGWHTLRHTFASQMSEADVSLQSVQELLGHSDIRTTMRYSHLAPSKLREAVGVLDSPKNGQQVVNTINA